MRNKSNQNTGVPRLLDQLMHITRSCLHPCNNLKTIKLVSLPNVLYFATTIHVLHQFCSFFPSSIAMFTTRRKNSKCALLHRQNIVPLYFRYINMEIKLHLEQTSMQLLTIIQKTLVPGCFKLIYFFKYSEFTQE